MEIRTLYENYSCFIKCNQQRSKISDVNVKSYNLNHKYFYSFSYPSNCTSWGGGGGVLCSTAAYCSSGHSSVVWNWGLLHFGQR